MASTAAKPRVSASARKRDATVVGRCVAVPVVVVAVAVVVVVSVHRSGLQRAKQVVCHHAAGVRRVGASAVPVSPRCRPCRSISAWPPGRRVKRKIGGEVRPARR